MDADRLRAAEITDHPSRKTQVLAQYPRRECRYSLIDLISPHAALKASLGTISSSVETSTDASSS